MLPITVEIRLSPELSTILSGLVDWLTRDDKVVSARLLVPAYRSLTSGERVTMTTNILSDMSTVVPVEFDNIAGRGVATPSGGTATVTNDNEAAVTATVENDAAGNVNLVLSPVQPAQLGAVANISVSDVVGGLTVTTPTVDFTVTDDVNAISAHIRTDEVTTRPLPTPQP